jgi:hypothetical protein
VKGFISYAHDDHPELLTFRKNIRSTERAYGVDFWVDKRIRGGNYWRTEIADAIAAAQVHILLMSPAFFDSDYIYDHELPGIEDKCSGGDLVIPVVLKRCSWYNFVDALQAIPTSPEARLKAVVDWRPQANGFDTAREQIDQAIAGHFGIKPRKRFFAGRP